MPDVRIMTTSEYTAELLRLWVADCWWLQQLRKIDQAFIGPRRQTPVVFGIELPQALPEESVFRMISSPAYYVTYPPEKQDA